MNNLIFRLIYTLFVFIAVPFIIVIFLKSPSYRYRILERFGIFNLPKNKPLKKYCIWVHAASFGETIAAAPMINKLLTNYPEYSITVTTTTPTGSSQVKKLFGEQVLHVYCPFDIPFFINNFIKKTKPKICILMETELWPNMINISKKKSIKVVLANARLSNRSKNRYKIVKSYISKLLNDLSLIIAQSNQDAEKFMELGCDENKLSVSNNIKFDINIPTNHIEKAEEQKKIFFGRKVIAAVSTHRDEEQQVLVAYKKALNVDPNCLLILVPRHPSRFKEVHNLCVNNNFKVVNKSSGQIVTSDINIWLGDTMGEMFFYLKCSDLVYVGGSLVNVGGHNILEPAALSLPIIVGPHLRNFLSISHQMLENNAIIKILDSNELSIIFQEFLGCSNLDKFEKLAENAKKVFLANQGGLKKLLSNIADIISCN